MVSRKGKPPAPAGGSDGRGRRAAKPVHAHDEFELDIDVDTELTQIGTDNPIPDLFGDDDDERTQEVTLDQLGELMRPKSEEVVAIPLKSSEEVLPVFMQPEADDQTRRVPRQAAAEPLPDPPLPPAAPSRVVPLPDLSDILPDPDEGRLGPMPEASALFDDISEVSDEPPVHSLLADNLAPKAASQPLTPLPQPPPSRPSRPRGKKPLFGTGLTGGMAPLDIGEFESEQPLAGKKKKKRRSSVGRRPAPMAGSQRVVRRWFQISFRDVILLALVIILALGVWVAWRIWQDYKSSAELGAYDQGRYQMEQARDDAIERSHPKKQTDIP